MEMRLLLGTVGGAFGSWINVYTVLGAEEEIVTAIPVMMVCTVRRRPRLMRGLSL